MGNGKCARVKERESAAERNTDYKEHQSEKP